MNHYMYHSIRKNLSRCQIGWNLSNRLVCLLLAAFSGLGTHRRLLRASLPWMIGWWVQGQFITLKLRIADKLTFFSLRKGDIADYLIAGEMIRGEEHLPPSLPPAKIIDAGANIGGFMIVASRMYPEVPMICYEPSASNFEILQKNARDNGIQVDLRCMGVWSKSCDLYFHAQASYNGYMSESESGLPAIPCELPEADTHTWLKMDTEGAEYEALPALFERNCFPYHISLELHHRIEKGNELISLARKHGYAVNGAFDSGSDCVNITLAKALP